MSFKKLTPLFPAKGSKINDEITETCRFVVFTWMFCRLFGLAPMKLTKSKQNGKTVWLASYSTGWAVYSCVMYIQSACMAIYGYLGTRKLPSQAAASLGAVHSVFVLAILTVGFVRCGTHIRCLIKARKLVEKARSIIIWSKTSEGNDNTYKIIVTFLLCFWNLVTICGMATHIIPELRVIVKLPLYEWFYGWCNFTICCMIMLFTTGLYSLKTTLTQINGSLKRINEGINLNTSLTGGCGDLRVKLSSIIEAHRLVGKAQALLGNDQSPVLLVVLLSIVWRSILFCSILLYDSGEHLLLSMFQIISCLCELFKLLCIVETCHWITTITNDIREDATHLLTSIWEFGLRSDLKYCLRQLKGQSMDFTAMDFYKIDRSLIVTICGLVLTNMIVIIQNA